MIQSSLSITDKTVILPPLVIYHLYQHDGKRFSLFLTAIRHSVHFYLSHPSNTELWALQLGGQSIEGHFLLGINPVYYKFVVQAAISLSGSTWSGLLVQNLAALQCSVYKRNLFFFPPLLFSFDSCPSLVSVSVSWLRKLPKCSAEPFFSFSLKVTDRKLPVNRITENPHEKALQHLSITFCAFNFVNFQFSTVVILVILLVLVTNIFSWLLILYVYYYSLVLKLLSYTYNTIM